jgi:hypothetical protein
MFEGQSHDQNYRDADMRTSNENDEKIIRSQS